MRGVRGKIAKTIIDKWCRYDEKVDEPCMLHACTHVCLPVHARMYVCMHVCMYVCMHVGMYIYSIYSYKKHVDRQRIGRVQVVVAVAYEWYMVF